MKLNMASKAMRNVLFSAIVLLPLQTTIGIIPTVGENARETETVHEISEVPPSAQPKVVLLDLKEEYCDAECILKKNSITVEFFSKTFGVDSSLIYEDLIKKNENTLCNEYNIGLIKDSKGLKEFSSFEEGLIEYLMDYVKNNPQQVSSGREAYDGSADYIVNLIKYFTSIYKNVDYLTAVSIGAAESGYYQVKYMLESNNIYGGMAKGQRLIKYKNIEYGVLSYIRLLSKSYYGKGLEDLEAIGKVYCPVYENGQKRANPHWIKLVNDAKTKYDGTDTDITVAQLNS